MVFPSCLDFHRGCDRLKAKKKTVKARPANRYMNDLKSAIAGTRSRLAAETVLMKSAASRAVSRSIPINASVAAILRFMAAL